MYTQQIFQELNRAHTASNKAASLSFYNQNQSTLQKLTHFYLRYTSKYSEESSSVTEYPNVVILLEHVDAITLMANDESTRNSH